MMGTLTVQNDGTLQMMGHSTYVYVPAMIGTTLPLFSSPGPSGSVITVTVRICRQRERESE